MKYILDTETEKEIIQKKNQGISNSTLMKEYNIKYHMIYQILKRNGRSKIVANKKYEVDDNYFENLNTEEKAYWLGFLYADGYVRMHKNRSGELKLKLAIDDKNHIELFKKCIKSTHIIKDMESSLKVNNKTYISQCSSISIYNTKIVSDLFELGCLNKKTKKLTFPDINTNLINHFIRGYFDGDGSISYGETSICMNFVSGSFLLLEKISEILNYYTNCKVANLVGGSENFKYLNYTSFDDILKIYNYLYFDSTIYLYRKKAKFDYIINNIEKIKEKIRENGRIKYELSKK